MSKLGAGVMALELLREHPDIDVHGADFREWARARELNTESARQLRVAVIRQRNFGGGQVAAEMSR